MASQQRRNVQGRPRVGFITESVVDDAGNLVEDGAERHLLRLATVAAGLGADVTVYQRGHRPWEGTCDGIGVVTRPAPLSVLGRTLARQAAGDDCTRLHFQDLERVPWGLSDLGVTATSDGIYWHVPYADEYRESYPGQHLAALAVPVWRLGERNRSSLMVGRCDQVLGTETSLLRFVQSVRPSLRRRAEVVMNFTDLVDNPGFAAGASGADAAVLPLIDDCVTGLFAARPMAPVATSEPATSQRRAIK